jgi:transcriptional regulator NrdR family protein
MPRLAGKQRAGDGIRCPHCGENRHHVLYVTRKASNEILRRRQCYACLGRFTTFESVRYLHLSNGK